MGRGNVSATGGTNSVDGGIERGSGGSGGAAVQDSAAATGGAAVQDGVAAMGGAAAQDGVAAMDGAPAQDAPSPAGCDGFENMFGQSVTVLYVNAGLEPLYLARPECHLREDRFALLDADGQSLNWDQEYCLSCEALQLGWPSCFWECPPGGLVKIEPGGSHELSWPGVYWRRTEMPTECYPPENDSWLDMHGNACSQMITAPPGLYTIVGTAWSDFACGSGQMCECDPGSPPGLSSCIVVGGAVAAGTSRQVTATLDYPTQRLVELRFE